MEKTEKAPLDFDDLFGGDTRVILAIKNRKVRFTFKEEDTQTYIEYQRRLAKVRSVAGKLEASDEALSTDLWLFDQLCTRVEVLDGEEWRETKNVPPPEVKRHSLFGYQRRIGSVEGDTEEGAS
jgi:hypothetical protein